MNLRNISSAVLGISLLVLCYQLYRIPKIDREYTALVEDFKSRNSLGNVAASGFQAFFDGLTFGKFAEEGMFTEAKKSLRMDADFTRQAKALAWERADCQSRRDGALLFLLGSAAGLYFTRPVDREVPRLAESSTPDPTPQTPSPE